MKRWSGGKNQDVKKEGSFWGKNPINWYTFFGEGKMEGIIYLHIMLEEK